MSYYMIPFTSLPASPGYKVWFASWSATQPIAYWSDTLPNVHPDNQSTWVVGVTQDETRPEGAQLLGVGAKNLPPPPLELSSGDVTLSGFQNAFAEWLRRREF